MAKKLARLIDDQDLAFDTHQSGDGQKIHWREIHMEKRMHNNLGKARFPLAGNAEPSKSKTMSDQTFSKISKEVRTVLRKNQSLATELAKTVANELHRFSSGKASEKDARKAAIKMAGYFCLDETFEQLVVNYLKANLGMVTTVHRNPNGKPYEIIQSADKIEVRQARKSIPRK